MKKASKVEKVMKILQIEEKPRFPYYFDWALTHSSYANEKGIPSYERLEFLGDTVVSLAIATQTFVRFPKMNEGDMAKIRAVMGSEAVLSQISEEIGLTKLVLMGKSLKETNDDFKSIFADVFESTMAAVYLNFGFEKACEIIKRLMNGKLEDVAQKKIFFDYKTMLQEHTQGAYATLPEYFLLKEEGPPHKRIYVFEVKVNGKTFGLGKGRSKKSAEQMAAKNALKKMKKL